MSIWTRRPAELKSMKDGGPTTGTRGRSMSVRGGGAEDVEGSQGVMGGRMNPYVSAETETRCRVFSRTVGQWRRLMRVSVGERSLS